MLLVCTLLLYVCISYVLVCTRKLLVCTRMLLVFYSHATRMLLASGLGLILEEPQIIMSLS